MWPWQRQRRALAEVQQEIADAMAEKQAAERRREAAIRQAERSSTISASLRHQIVLNGFTELLQEAWGKR